MSSQHDNSGAIRVFISYSRHDMEIADRLVEALGSEGFQVTIDRRDCLMARNGPRNWPAS